MRKRREEEDHAGNSDNKVNSRTQNYHDWSAWKLVAQYVLAVNRMIDENMKVESGGIGVNTDIERYWHLHEALCPQIGEKLTKDLRLEAHSKV